MQSGKRTGEALKRIGIKREMRKRLAARPREPQLRAHHTPLLGQRGLRTGEPDVYPVVVAERRADRRQGALGHDQRIAHRSLAAVEQHPHRARTGIQPTADDTPDTR